MPVPHTVDKAVKPGTARAAVGGGEDKAAKNKAENLLGNMFSNGLKTLTGATKSFEFDEKERERAQAGLGALICGQFVKCIFRPFLVFQNSLSITVPFNALP